MKGTRAACEDMHPHRMQSISTSRIEKISFFLPHLSVTLSVLLIKEERVSPRRGKLIFQLIPLNNRLPKMKRVLISSNVMSISILSETYSGICYFVTDGAYGVIKIRTSERSLRGKVTTRLLDSL